MAAAPQLHRRAATEEAAALSLLIRETTRSLLAFAIYRSVTEREPAIRALKEQLPLPVVEFTLSKQVQDPIRLLRTVPADERRCIFFYDAEEALPEVAGYVNLQREAFADVPHAVVFWVNEHGLRELATHAPDFWAWRSGVFDFRSEQVERPLAAMQTMLAEPLIFKDRGDLERRISLYQGLIREHSEPEQPDEGFLARLHVRLADALHTLTRFDEAAAHAQQALEHSQRAGDRDTEAHALHTLGILAQERWQLEAAEDLYRQSLTISEELSDEAGVAVSYHQLGNVADLRQQFDQAEKWYRKSLEMNERLGNESGAASTYGQLGILTQEHQQYDQAEQWYQKALAIFERLGLEADAATAYHQLGILAQERQQFDQAEQWYQQALAIKKRLGHPPWRVDTLALMGVLRRRQNRADEAVAWYGRALTIAAEYEMPVGTQILMDLARVIGAMGEDAFAAAWRQAFEGQEPPLEDIRGARDESAQAEGRQADG